MSIKGDILRALHVLANGPPDVNGYAIRTHSILRSQNELDEIDSIALTSPWYPDRISMKDNFELDQIKYLRTKHPIHAESNNFFEKIVKIFTPKRSAKGEKKQKTKTIINPLKKIITLTMKPIKLMFKLYEEKVLIRTFTKKITAVAKEMDAEIIHAHTPYRVGYPAFLTSRKLGIPFVYEVRGLWEDTAVANGRWRENGLVYRRFRRKETFLMSNADAVVCISEALKQDLVERGIKPDKIVVVPNGIEPHLLEHGQEKINHAEVLEFEQKKQDTVTIGYIGSLRKLEGVDYTAEAVSILQKNGYDVRFFVLTGISGQKELLAYCKKLGILDKTLVFGPVPHNEVAGYYDLIDLFVVSRPKFRVTDLVTPLKPYEAMFHGKPIISADLLAFREIIEHGVTGLLYPPDDVNSLAKTLERCINEEGLVEQLSSAGKSWVLNQRSWDKLAIRYSQLYKTIIKSSE